MITTIQSPAQKIVSSMTAGQLKSYLVSKGYSICNVTPITNSKKWLAILTKNKEYVIATVYTGEKGVEKIEESLM